VKHDALLSATGWLMANDVAKSIQRTCKPPLPNGINPKTLWNGKGSDLKKSAENWTRPSIFAAFTGILLHVVGLCRRPADRPYVWHR